MGLEDLVLQQDENALRIQKAVSNIKKAGLDRRTLEFYQARLKELDALWEGFNKLDNTIRKWHGNEVSHPYFIKDIYRAVADIYSEARDDIEKHLSKFATAEKAASDSIPTTSGTAVAAQGKSAASDPESTKATNVAQTASAPVSASTSAQIQKQRKIIEIVRNSIRQVLSDTAAHPPHYYSMHAKSIGQHWQAAQDLHKVIWDSLATIDESVYDFDAYIQIEEDINNDLIRLQDLALMSPPAARISMQHNSEEIPTLKLPRIELPKFDGNYLKWRQFHDLFMELINNQPISACQKMWYLQSSLTGEAGNLIKHLTTSASNYDAAWKIINDRYENTRCLVFTTLAKLMSQPAATSENASSIKALHDTTQECILSLQNLGVNTDNWDSILIYTLVQLLSKATHALWEQSLTEPKKLPTLDEFLKFLNFRFQSLEALGPKATKVNTEQAKNGSYRALSAAMSSKLNCIQCNHSHALYTCPKFLAMTPNQRLNCIQKAKHCVNCLKDGHKARDCTSGSCHKCNKKHNTLLHLDDRQSPAVNKTENSTAAISATTQSTEAPVSLAAAQRQSTMALLSTVYVTVTDKWGKQIQCRALLDNGSQTNFITKSLAGRLGLQKSPCAIGVEGIGQTKNRIAERVNIQLSATATDFSKHIEAHIIPKIVSNQPSCTINTSNWNLPKNIQLADPSFNESRSIDILIGAGSFYSSLCIGQITLGDGLPILQNTLFGWIVGGEYNNHNDNLTCGICTEDDSLSNTMEKFWRLEECETRPTNFTAAEMFCEKLFIQHTSRHSDGRFVVRLPFLHDPQKLGTSKDIALQRFYAIERKLLKNSEIKQQYVNFMREYEQLGHVEEVSLSNIKGPHFFLPHHAVFKPDSTTTKLRVVFDASAKTSTNLSLNDILATGPTIQDDVFTTIIRFRLPRYAFTADIEKMYRQIWMHKDDRKYQLIWWREDQSKPLRCLQLSTVTYGTTSAPYLAIRSLQAIAEEQADNFPLAAEVAKSNFYVDDVLCGSDQLSTALEIQAQLRRMLDSAGFKLRKWGANHQDLLKNIPTEDQERSTFNNSEKEHIKTMGLIWHPKMDIFTIRIEKVEISKVTKRTALADIARLFDPLGFIAPVTVTAKIFLQELWNLKLDWDAPLPQNLHNIWIKFRQDLQLLSTISIPRHVFCDATSMDPQIHIFADASEKAYGAVAYVRTTDDHNINHVRFLCAKSRVAPVKQITLPRLELCAAKLAVDVLQKLQENNIFKTIPVFFWSDSTAVLGWINANSAHYHTFVANRISMIQQISSPKQWRHVQSENNPADLISRGLTPDKLINNNFWFYGPTFLQSTVISWPLETQSTPNYLEMRKNLLVATATTPTISILDNINHKNSFRCLQRVVSYMLRFIHQSQGTTAKRNMLVSNTPTADEMENALYHIIKVIQQQDFSDERTQIMQHSYVNNSSSISNLKPFIDKKGILRVGGRLTASTLSYDAKHQILLPYRNPITTLLLSDLHKEHLHVGPQTLISIVKQRFWPIKVKILARSIVKNCVQCARAKPKLFQQLMGNLPEDRVQPARPFIISGVDFFGPVWTHFKIRGKRPLKSYVAVFCCFSTKAVHLELVTDLSTEAFIGALKRFMARRGHCKKLYCDNATNFVGAKNYLEELHKAIHGNKAIEKITNECNKRSMEFSFIPPRAPHFGGLWEAAVKSAKHLLQHTLAAASLTYEEMETVVIQAEAIMNSRPITPITNDPTDLQALTPGHLLIGEPLTSTVDPVAGLNTANNLKRWKLVTQLREDFWKRWSSEYLNSLQHRYKWKQECHNAKPGMMVVIKDDNLPPLKWALGRIEDVVRGQDGLVRVADVRTATNILRRPIHKLAPLPIENETPREESTPIIPSQTITEPPKGKQGSRLSKGTRLQTTSSLLTMLLVCLFLPPCLFASIEIQQFDTNPGIYFENLGVAEVIISDWTVITYIEMHAYWKEIEIVNGLPNLLNKSCEATHSYTHCSTTVKLIERLVNAINSNNLLLTSNHASRTKRGAFNFVGNVARSLFGVLDSEYAEEAALTIEKIRQNENHLISQIRNQTSFLDSTINIMKRNQQEIKDSFQKTEKFLNAVRLNIASLQQQLDKERAAQIFNEIALQATLQLLHLQHSQDSLLDILTDTHHGKISPELISPQQLQNELLNIKANVPNHLKLPISSMELLKYYNLMTIQGRLTANYVIFKIKIPLVAIDDYELLKLTATPWLSNGTFYKIHPAYPFLMINLHRDNYYPLSEIELRYCMVTEDNYLCQLKHPLYNSGSNESACEVNLLQHKTTTDKCAIEAIGPGPHWIQLHDPNTWLFSVANELTINAVCGTNFEEFKIQHTGLIKLSNSCVIRQPLLTIQGYKTLQGTNRRSYTPSINISDFIIPSERTPLVESFSATYVSQQEELQTIKEQLSTLQVDLPNQLRPHDIHHFILGYICLATAICISIIVYWRHRTAHKADQPPQPNDEIQISSPQEPDLSRITVYQHEG